jgi:hypothetical protein
MQQMCNGNARDMVPVLSSYFDRAVATHMARAYLALRIYGDRSFHPRYFEDHVSHQIGRHKIQHSDPECVKYVRLRTDFPSVEPETVFQIYYMICGHEYEKARKVLYQIQQMERVYGKTLARHYMKRYLHGSTSQCMQYGAPSRNVQALQLAVRGGKRRQQKK